MEKCRQSNVCFRQRSKTTLLCESDARNCEEVSELLQRFHCQVISKSSPVEVINVLFAEGYRIGTVLIVVDLPSIDKGILVLKYIMHFKEFKHIPVIVLSTQKEPSLMHKCMKLGAADFLVKPLCIKRLLNLVGTDIEHAPSCWCYLDKQHQKSSPTSEFGVVASNKRGSYRRNPIMLLEGTGDNFYLRMEDTDDNVSATD